jgi:hypothetical protein
MMVGFGYKLQKDRKILYCFLLMKAKEKSSLSLTAIISFLLLFSFVNLVFSQTDTIGRTTYDLQFIGPACKVAFDSNDYYGGIHTAWLHSLDTVPFSDLLMYYNFYAYSNSQWRWRDTGVSGFLSLWRNNVANLDIDIYGHAAFSGYRGSTYVLIDDSPGHGFFLPYPISDSGYQYPILSIGSINYYYIAAIKNDSIYYIFSRHNAASWTNWRSLGYAGYPSHNICASKNSGKVCVLWTVVDSTRPDWGVLYMTTSQDSGQTWSTPAPISNDIPSNLRNTFLGGYAIYDNNDNVHVVTQTYDGYHVKPVELWHYCPANNPAWSRIAYLTTDTLLGNVGYGALYACRPSICQSSYHSIFGVMWEQFRWDDVDSVTGDKYLRADIYWAGSGNYGANWSSPYNLTNSVGISERSPYLVNVIPFITPVIEFEYMIDRSAGIYAKGEGINTINPIVFKIYQMGGVEENNFNQLSSLFKVSPNPFSKSVAISFNQNSNGEISISIYDRNGRLIRILKNNAERNIVLWDGRDKFGKIVSDGIYFIRFKTKDYNTTKKIIMVK